MTAEVEHKSIRKKQLGDFKGRHISGYEKSYRGRGHRGRGGRGRGGRGNFNRGGKLTTAWVDGKQVESRFYKADEFQKLTPKQRSKVVELRRQQQTPSTGGGDRLSSTIASIASLRDDMSTMGDAIVAGVARASGEVNEDQIGSDVSTASSSKHKASSGSVGSFIANRRKNLKKP